MTRMNDLHQGIIDEFSANHGVVGPTNPDWDTTCSPMR